MSSSCKGCRRTLAVEAGDEAEFGRRLSALEAEHGELPSSGDEDLLNLREGKSFAVSSGPAEYVDRALRLGLWALRVVDMDVPLCGDCSREALRALQAEVAEHEEAKRGYEAVDIGAAEGGGEGDEDDEGDEDLEALEAQLREELQQQSAQRQAQRAHTDALAAMEAELEALEAALWRQRHERRYRRACTADNLRSNAAQLKLTTRVLDCFKQLNVCNDAFHIWFRGPFATVNGFRLGRLPAMPVEWPEINAAMGQAAMLLLTISTKAQFKFTKHRIHPLGSFSKMSKTDDASSTCDLYYDGSLNPFRKRSYNLALSYFLSCLEEAGTYAQLNDPTLRLPYTIRDGKINDVSVQLGNDERWTKALKYQMTNLKWLVAWTARHADANRSQADARAAVL